MEDGSGSTRAYIKKVASFESWLLGLSHIDNICWRRGGKADLACENFVETIEKCNI